MVDYIEVFSKSWLNPQRIWGTPAQEQPPGSHFQMYKEEGSNWELSSCSYEVKIMSDSLDTFYDGLTDLVAEGIEVGIV